MQGQGSDFRGRALLVLAAAFACHMGLGFTYIYGPLQPDVTADLGIGRGDFALAAELRNVVVGLTGPLVGLLVVRFGSRPVLGASLVVLCSSTFLLSQVRDWSGLLGATVVLGMGISGVGDLTVGHAVSRWFQRSRGAALGILYTASNLGGMLLVPLVSSMAAESSWREALQWIGGVGLVVLLPCAALVLPPPRARPVDDTEEEGASIFTERDMDLGAALRTRSFWVLVYVHIAYFAFAVAIVAHFVTYLMDRGLPRGEAAGLWSSAIGLGIASKLAFGFLSDRLRARSSMFILFGLFSASSLVLLLASSQTSLWVFVGLFGFSYAARDVLTPLIVIDCFGVRYMAKIYGALMPTLVVGGLGGSYFTGLCADTLGSYLPAFATLSVMNLIAFLLLALLRRELELRNERGDLVET